MNIDRVRVKTQRETRAILIGETVMKGVIANGIIRVNHAR